MRISRQDGCPNYPEYAFQAMKYEQNENAVGSVAVFSDKQLQDFQPVGKSEREESMKYSIKLNIEGKHITRHGNITNSMPSNKEGKR